MKNEKEFVTNCKRGAGRGSGSPAGIVGGAGGEKKMSRNMPRVWYRGKNYTPTQLWRLIDALNRDRFEINICCLPYCEHFPEKGRANFIAQIQAQRRSGIDVCAWGISPFDALKNAMADIGKKTGGVENAAGNFYGFNSDGSVIK